jgi:hypothetical protein
MTGDLASVPLDLLLYFNRNYLFRPLALQDPDLPWSELLLQVGRVARAHRHRRAGTHCCRVR